jgi:hypothetical protein
MRNLIRAFSVIGLLQLSGCGLLPSRALPIEAWVVDAETKQPLENVIVRVQWRRYTSNGLHQTGSAPFIIEETVTDSNGRFYFPEWEQRVPNGILTSSLSWSSPGLIFVKEGYKVLVESNVLGVARDDKPSALKSRWHGKVIPLAKPKDQKEYEEDILWLGNSDVHHIINLGCMWENIPRTLAFLFKEKKRLLQQNVSNRPKHDTYEIRNLRDMAHLNNVMKATKDIFSCANPETFLKEYLQ